jgi:hypothetical protein
VKIVQHGRYRWEYILDERRGAMASFLPKRWRLLAEGIAASVEVRTMQEAYDLLTPDHPALVLARDIFMDTRERVDFAPWVPFEPCKELLEALGPHVVERMQAKEHDVKVWSSVDGWTWLHMFGDAATL